MMKNESVGSAERIRDLPEDRRRESREDIASISITPDLRAELLDPESWGPVLELYASTMKLAVALVDVAGQMVGTCHNPQPIWSLAADANADWPRGDCVFCLESGPRCTAAADALRTMSVTVAHDQGGFSHVALPLTLGDQHVGTLLAGQVLDRYPELLPLQRVAREFGLPPQQVWNLARQKPPVSRATLIVYGELLKILGETFLRDRYRAILENRWRDSTEELNRELANVNSTLQRNVAELDRSNSYLRNFFDSTDIATMFLNREMVIQMFTPAAAKWFKFDINDIGRSIADLGERFACNCLEEDVPDGARQSTNPAQPVTTLVERIAEVVRALPTGVCQDYRMLRELGLAGAHGQHYLMRIFPYCTNKGIINGVVITFVDVTNLKKAEQLAAGAKVYAESIVATVPEPLLVLDDKFRVNSANNTFYETFHVRADETEGQQIFDLGNHQWDIPELRQLLADLLPGDHWVHDLEVRQEFQHIGSKSMVINARRIDRANLILLAIRDVTALKESEDSLLKLNLNLKNFSYAASHDLQQPLRTVMIYTQLLAKKYKGKLDPEAEEFIGFAVEGATKIESLLSDLREYWLVTERMEQRIPLDCNAILQKVIQVLQVTIEESGASVTHDPLPTILAEDVSLSMLFQNLVGNAIKYVPKGKAPSIHIGAKKTANAWCFSVTDNGIGIKPEHLEQIFAPFKRLHGNEYKGTGIGLALCSKVIERYGGRIWAESTYGEGSTFLFTIPDIGDVVR